MVRTGIWHWAFGIRWRKAPRARYGFIQVPLLIVSIGLRGTALAFRAVGTIGGRLAGRFLTPRALGRATRRAGIIAGTAGRTAFLLSPLDELAALASGKDLDFVRFQSAQIRDKLERQQRRDLGLPLRGAVEDLKPHMREAMVLAARRILREAGDSSTLAPEAIEAIYREELAAAGKRAAETVQTNFDAALQAA